MRSPPTSIRSAPRQCRSDVISLTAGAAARPRSRPRRGTRRRRALARSTRISATSRRCRSATACTSSARAPADGQRTDTLVALARVPRSERGGRMRRCIARSPPISGSAFDPLTRDLAATWTGPRPAGASLRVDATRRRGGRRRHGRADRGLAARSWSRARLACDARLDAAPRAVLAWIDAQASRPAHRRLRERPRSRRSRRPRRPLRAARPVGRADARAARRAADGAQLLLRRCPRRADPAAWRIGQALGRAPGRALLPGGRRMAARDGAVRLGHVATCAPAATTSPRRWR